jgi:23S rRNA-/tRNA-specific pseudouridylate synthase
MRRVNAGDTIKRLMRVKPAAKMASSTHIPPVVVAYEDDYIAVVVKPPGMPVHGETRVDAPAARGKRGGKGQRGPIPSLRTAIVHGLQPSAAKQDVLRRPQHAHRWVQ